MILIRFENGHFAPRRTWFGFAWGGVIAANMA